MSNFGKIKKSNRWLPTETKDVLYGIIKNADEKLKINNDDLTYLKIKGIALHKLCYHDNQNIENTIQFFDRILQIEPTNKEFLKRKGMLLLRKETTTQATRCFDMVLQMDPKDSEALWGKGYALQIDGKPYSAIDYFDKSLEIDPLDAQTWVQKGFALSARGETWEQALECFDKALAINSDDARVWKGKASVLHKKNNLHESILCYDKAIALDPRDWEALTRKGFALTGENEFEEAISCFDKSLLIKNDSIETLRGKGDAVYKSGRYDEAFTTYNKISQINPKYTDALRQKAFCLLHLNKKKDALYCFEQVLEIDPDDVNAQKERLKLIDQGIHSSKNIPIKQSNLGDENYAIIVEKISKSFKIHHEKKETLFSIITSVFSKKNYEIINVLEDVTFNLKRGEMLGIIGRNGSGKTTLLRVLAGILNPDSGKVKTNGTVAPLLQLGVGFNGELTARENIILAGMLLGFSKKEIVGKVDDIIKFAELEKFLDTKVKNFSSGMHARLAFSTAIQVDPDILLVDEILAVGDINFVKKSYREFLSFREKGKSIIFVSHSLDQIRNLCDKAMILESGKIRMIGKPEDVIQYYIESNT